MSTDDAATRVIRDLVEEDIADLLGDAGVLDLLRDYARLVGDTRGLVPTLRSAIVAAYGYESAARRGVIDAAPEWVRIEVPE